MRLNGGKSGKILYLIGSVVIVVMQGQRSAQIDNDKSRMIEHFMAQVKAEDMMNLAFMKPIEVTLRTHKHDKEVPADSLPRGLMIAQKTSINDNKYALKRLRPVEATHLEDLRANQMDNYISLLKKTEVKDEVEAQRMSRMQSQRAPERQSERQSRAMSEVGPRPPKHHGMEVGICVSMKSEQKKGLKSTLKGVANNIDMMVRSGVSPDDIFVVVVIDGVRSVDKSLYEYFQQFERESQIFLQQDEQLTIRKKYEHQLYHSQVQKDQPLNYSKFLFKQQQFQERIDGKFVNVRSKYDEVLRIQNSISNIKKEKASDNQNLKMIVNRLADKQKTILKRINKGKEEKNIVINQESIMKELASSEEECHQYVNTRQDLSYVSVYRLPTTSLSEECKLKAEELNQRDSSEMDQQERLSTDQAERRSLHKTLNKNGKISSKVLYVNLFFCIKYKEAGKLNSHNWFLNGFCQELNPRFSFLIDVGVRPYPDAIFKMYRHMKMNPNVGGVCGYLRLIEELVQDEEMVKDDDLDCLSSCLRHIFDIQRAQQIETHYDNILEKSFEALFKFIHVVPGFFSGYSMNAIRPPGKKDELLREYFRSVDDKLVSNKIVDSNFTCGGLLARVLLPRSLWKRIYKVDADSEEQLLANENTYQAENRILCLGIHRNNKDITFMPNAYAQVEPIKRINDLMEHRKQQINAGMFSFEKVENEFDQVVKKREKFFIRFQLFYISSLKFLTFFAPALLMFLLQFAAEIIQSEFLQSLLATESESGLGNVVYRTFENLIIFLYALCMFSVLFFSLHLNAKDKKYTYYAHLVSTTLGVFTLSSFLVFLVHIILNIVQDDQSYLEVEYVDQLSTFMDRTTAVLVADILTYLLYTSLALMFLPSICYSIIFGKFSILWEVLIGSLAYLFYVPTQYCVLQMYARCRMDDVYGKNSVGARNQKLRETWNIVKLVDVSKYLFWNVIVGITLLLLHDILLVKFFLLLFLLTGYIILFLIKWIPGLIYLISYKCQQNKNPLEPSDEERDNDIVDMKLRIFDTIKQFEDDFSFNIKESFQEAAEVAQSKEKEKKAKLEAAQKKAEDQMKAQKARANPTVNRSGSIAFDALIGVPLTNKVQTIRESSAVRPSYYPFQEGIAKKAPPKQSGPSNLPLQMVLLKNQIGNEVNKNAELKEGEDKLRKYENFRTTIKPLGF